MKSLAADRRRNIRMPAAYPATICDRHGRFLARGRITNVSETGVFFVGTGRDGSPRAGRVVLEMDLPEAKPRHGRREGTRKVQHLVQIVRAQTLGYMLGLGLKFIEKLS